MYILMNVYMPAVNKTVVSSCSLREHEMDKRIIFTSAGSNCIKWLHHSIIRGYKIQLRRFDSGSDLLKTSVRESHY
jgi:hypothetical protein